MPVDTASLKRFDQTRVGTIRVRKTWEEVEVVNPNRISAAEPTPLAGIYEPVALSKRKSQTGGFGVILDRVQK